MKRPRVLNDTPRGGWTYRQPETGMTFRENHPKALQAAVWSHRLSLPDLNMDVTGGWDARLLNDICEQNEYLDCEDTENPGKFPNLTDVFSWATSMLHWRDKGYATVPMEEAERRAAICVKCPHNRPVAGCLGCKGAGDLIDRISGGLRTSQAAKLHQCSVCSGCVLNPKVFLPLEVINTEAYASQLPSYCWLLPSAS